VGVLTDRIAQSQLSLQLKLHQGRLAVGGPAIATKPARRQPQECPRGNLWQGFVMSGYEEALAELEAFTGELRHRSGSATFWLAATELWWT